ncbi:MAG: DUF1559 domain-containing protein [Pirellulaceae bacterium]|jgi:hypothetical protein|nr:DUF1559 domain-containing protein [Pirellulaceae bacterium]
MMNVIRLSRGFTWLQRFAILLACLAFVTREAPHTTAGEERPLTDDLAVMEPFVSETTILVVRMDPQRIALPDLAGLLPPVSFDVGTHLMMRTSRLQSWLDWLREFTGGQPVFASVGLPISSERWPAFLFVRDAPGVEVPALLTRLGRTADGQSCRHAGCVVVTPTEGVDVRQLLESFPPVPRADLKIAFEAAGGHPVQLVVLPPDYVRATIQDLLPELPAQIGGGSSDLLTDGILWAALGIDPAQLQAELTIQSASPAAAERLAGHIPGMLTALGSLLPDEQAATAAALVRLVQPQVSGDRVIMRIATTEQTTAAAGVLLQLVEQSRNLAIRRAHMNRLKQIMLALHNYHDVHRAFPPGDAPRGADGTSGLSWRVHMLPFIGHAELYQQFHLDEPWDSPHNKSLLDRMPDIYRIDSPSFTPGQTIAPGHTTLLAPVGDDTVFGQPQATKLNQILDGTSNTVVLVEVKPEYALPWTKPTDYALDTGDPARGLQLGSDGRFLAALADGSVHALRGDLPAATLLHLFQMSDGQMIDWDAVR